MPMRHRARIFLRFHDLVLARQAQLLDLIQLESGKARVHAFEEVADTAIVSRHYARRAAGYLRPRRRQGAFPLLSQAVELRHPRVVVGIVATELPAVDVDQRRDPRAACRQCGGASAGQLQCPDRPGGGGPAR
jgi:acyl-CoA reductase-like NAD-dependent aldehyde dehydrogenase